MTPDELAAIRERDAFAEADIPPERTWEDWHEWGTRDRRALLAHIDALATAVKGLPWIDDGVPFVDQSEEPLTEDIDHALVHRAAVLALLRGER